MPANLPPQYVEAEKVYRQAKTPEEKVEALETMLAIMPKHKGTDKLRADLRRKIAKFTEEAQRRPSIGRQGSAYNIRKEGAGQIVLVGLPNAGKSQLVSALTDAVPEVADYPFATKVPLPGMMRFENIQIQLLDMPPITDREAKPWFSQLLRNADILLLVVDLVDDPLMQLDVILAELESMKIRLITAVKEAEEELVPGIARKKALIVGSKSDAEGSGERRAILESRYGGSFPVVAVSAKEDTGLNEMKQAVYEKLDIIRVYTKSPGKKADFEDPMILKKGSTVEDAAEDVHKDFRNRFKYAQIWGSGKFNGQRVKREHVLNDYRTGIRCEIGIKCR
jgi:ribosome-interacting GTPase 1